MNSLRRSAKAAAQPPEREVCSGLLIDFSPSMKRAGADVTERFQLWTGIGEQRCAAFPYADLCWCCLAEHSKAKLESEEDSSLLLYL
jgi:hypothetical protein